MFNVLMEKFYTTLCVILFFYILCKKKFMCEIRWATLKGFLIYYCVYATLAFYGCLYKIYTFHLKRSI